MRDPARQERRGDEVLVFLGVGLLVALLASVLGVWVAAAASGHGHGSPLGWLRSLGDSSRSWSTSSTIVLILEVAVVVGAAVYGVVRWRKWSKGRAAIDSRARFMSTPADVAALSAEAGARDAARLNVEGAGLPLGTSVLRQRRLLSGWEWSLLMVMGTRAGKTSCEVVPRVLAAGSCPVVTTSNKPEVFTMTRAHRESLGRVWCLDLQGIALQESTWWWNPLDFVTGVERADELVDILAAAVMPGNARTDAYFTSASRSLLSGLLLAAAVNGDPITQVFAWLSDPDQRTANTDPAGILREAGYDQVATDLAEKMHLTPKQRDGVYGGAREWVSFMRSPQVMAWITPGEQADRRRLRAQDFVASTDTLYLLSKGRGGASGRAVVAALTRAVMVAGEELAARQGGRVARPVVFELDEAANVCRIPELPDLFTFYGGLGLLIATYLQNPAQGEECWGENGWRQMFSSANALLVGRGIRDDKFLPAISAMIGDRHWVEDSRSRHRGGVTRSEQHRQEQIVTTSDLVALSTGRAILHASGVRPVLVRLDHWSSSDWMRHAIEESQRLYQPSGLVDDTDDARPLAWAPTAMGVK